MTVIHNNKSDDQGRPAGGCTHGRGFTVAWQDGPLGPVRCPGCGSDEASAIAVDPPCNARAWHQGGGRSEPNGAFVEDVIAAAIGRLEFYQASPFACDENAAALAHLRSALEDLRDRTAHRVARGVEGTHDL